MLKKIFTRVVLYNILIAIGIIILLLFIVQRGLNSYTRHGESITVPDLRGMSFEQVKNTLGSKNLYWQIMDSVYDMNKPPLSIVDQNPKPSSKVKEGRTIYITINAVTAPTTEVPDLIGRSSYKYAKMQLESYGLKVGDPPIYKPDPHLNAVIGMMVNGRSVTKKTKVPKGTVVDLILGDGLGSSRISVPYVLGMKYGDAEFKLKGSSLNIGSVVVADGVTDTADAVITRQMPEYGPGKSIRMGEAIDLWIAKELPEGMQVDQTLWDKVDMDTIASQ